jgi:WD40 repeat protein
MQFRVVTCILSIFFLVAAACFAQGEFRAKIVIEQENADVPPGKYFNIDKGNSDGLMEGDLLRVKRAFNGQLLDVAGVRIIAVTPNWARVVRSSEDLGKRILNTDFLVRERSRDTISFVAQIGHSRPVNVITVSADEKLIASGALDGSVKIWDRASRHLLLSIQAFEPDFSRFERVTLIDSISLPTETITALAFSPDSKFLAIGSSSQENNLKLWDIGKGKPICTFVDDEGATVLSVRTRFARSVRSDSPVIEWQGPIKAIQFSPDGNLLAAGSSLDADVKIWDVKSKLLQKKLQLDPHDPHIDERLTGSFAFSNDGVSLATAYKTFSKEFPNGKQAIKEWNVGSWQPGEDFSGEIDLSAELISSSQYPYLIALASPSGVAALGDWKKKLIWKKYDSKSPGQIGSLGGNGLIAISGDGKIQISSLDSQKPPKEFVVDARPPIRWSRSRNDDGGDWDPNPKDGPDTFVSGPTKLVPICFSSSGKWLVWGRYDGTISIWNSTSSSDPIQLTRTASTVQSLAVVTNSAFEQDLLATTDSTGEVHLWSLRSGSLIKTFTGLRHGAQAISFSSDGTKLTASAQFEVATWDIENGQFSTWEVNDENAARRLILASAMNSTKDLLALGRNDGYVDVWDEKNRTFLGRAGHFAPGVIGARIGPGFISKVVLSNSGELVAFQKQGGAMDVWNYKSQTPILEKRCGGTALAFSSDDRFLVCGLGLNAIVWNLKKGTVEKELKGTEQLLTSIAFNADTTKVIGGAFRAVEVWDFPSGELERTLHDNTTAIALNALGGTSAVSINEDSTIGIYSTEHPALLAKGVTWDRNDWLSFSSDGFFDGTTRAWNELEFQSELDPLQLFDLERFFLQFYQPGLISTVLDEGRPIREVLASRNDSRASMDMGPLKKSHLPVIHLTTIPSGQTEITARSIQIAVKAEDTGSGVQDCRVFRNGILVYRDRQNLRKDGEALTLNVNMTVMAGRNTVNAYCFNSNGLKSKDRDHLLLTGSKSLYRKGKAYILSIGVDEYEGSMLHYARADAVAIAHKLSTTLSTTAQYELPAPIVLLDSEATKGNILWAIRTFAGDRTQGPAPLPKLQSAASLQPEDALIIYFAGHGFAQGEHYYLLPHDYLQRISEQDLEEALEGIDASHLALIIDSCESGNILSPQVRTGPINSGGLAQLAYEKGAYILVASQSDQPAREFDSLKHGLLTWVLINNAFSILQKGPSNNPYIYMGDWLSTAVNEVPIVHSHLPEENRKRSENVSFGKSGETKPSRIYWYQVPGLYSRDEGEEIAFPIAKLQR